MRITLLTWGTRGDVQPCIALAIGLRKAGYSVRLCADDDFKPLMARYDLELFSSGAHFGDFFSGGPTQSAGRTGRSQFGAAWQMMRTLRQSLNGLMEAAWQASQDSDAIVFSSVPLYGYHMAEALQVPCFWALSMPVFNRTRAWPNPVFPLRLPLGGGYNLFTHMLIEQAWQQLLGRTFNQWRERVGLPAVPLRQWPYAAMHGKAVTCLYHYSPSVMPKPADWGDHIHVTGYWLLDHDPAFQPPADLLAFLAAGPAPVYIGFGSMSQALRDPRAITDIAVAALVRAGQRGVVSIRPEGPSRLHQSGSIFIAGSLPHDWLFAHMAAVVHHGGAGTTGAGLRAGIPNVVVPFMGDQPFWGERVRQLGAGPKPIPRSQLTVQRLASAIREATDDEPTRERAAALGRAIRAEQGVPRAVEIINRQLSPR